MAEMNAIGKVIAATLATASVAVWFYVALLWHNRRSAIDSRPHEPLGWNDFTPLIAFAAAFMAPTFLLGALGRSDWKTPQGVPLISACAVAQIVLVVGIFAASGPLRRVDFGLELSEWRRDVAIGAGGFLASLLPVYGVNWVVTLAGWRSETGQHPFLKLLADPSDKATVVWIAVSVIVAAPLAEELLFRVILQGWLSMRLPATGALVVSSVAFAGVHVEKGRPDYLPLFPLALILGYVYQRRHSYLAVVVIHALFNAMNLALALLGDAS